MICGWVWARGRAFVRIRKYALVTGTAHTCRVRILQYTVVYYTSSMAATVEGGSSGGRNVCAVLRAKGDLQLVSLCLFKDISEFLKLYQLLE